jgi:hypothetical protein
MPLLEGHLATDRASRYLVQLCRHAAAMDGRVHTGRAHPHGVGEVRTDDVAAADVVAEWTATCGTVTFSPWGRCTLSAGEAGLTLVIDAPDELGLTRIHEVVTRDLERFTHRTAEVLTWHRPGPRSNR